MAQHTDLHAHLDHLVVAAADLDSGRAWLEERLGVPLQPGGEHGYFGTHNLLLGLHGGYLELIAVNPAAPAPPRPRWYELDTPQMRRRLQAGPALIHWVASVPDLEAALRVSPERHGEALSLSRLANRWQLSVPADGSLPMHGVLPSLIQWESLSPAARLPGPDRSVQRLSLYAPQPERVQRVLDALRFTGTPLELQAGPPRLEATLKVGGRVVRL